MYEYIPSQQNININISYNVDGPKLSKTYFGKKISKNTKIPDKDNLDLHAKLPKKVQQITTKLQENRQSLMQNKNNKTKKKNLKTLNNGDIGYEKRVKTQGNAHLDFFSTCQKKQSRNGSKIFQKCSSQHYKSVNNQTTQLQSKPTSKKGTSSQPKIKKSSKKAANKSCFGEFSKKPTLMEVQHIVSTLGPGPLAESKVQKKRANSASLIKNDKMVNKLLNMSIINSEMGGSIVIGSQNREANLPESSKNLKFLLNSIDVRLIKQMQTDNKQNPPSVLKDIVGDGIELITYLNKIKRISIEKLNTSAIKIQRFWRSKVRKSVVTYYSGLFKHAASGIKTDQQSLSFISQIQGLKQLSENGESDHTYSNLQIIQKLAENQLSEKQEKEQFQSSSNSSKKEEQLRSFQDELKEENQEKTPEIVLKNELYFEENEVSQEQEQEHEDYQSQPSSDQKQSLSLNIKKYRQIVDRQIRKSNQQQILFEKFTQKSKQGEISQERPTQQWNNINKLISEKMNVQGGVINSKQLLDQLMKQSLLHKKWIDDDINGDSQKQSSKSSFNKIILKNVEEDVKKQINENAEQYEDQQSNQEIQNDYNWSKYSGIGEKVQKTEEELVDKNQNGKWIEDQIMMENGVVQNYLDCGLSNFGIKLQETVHHNSRQDNNEEEIFSNGSQGKLDQEQKIYIFSNDEGFENKRNNIEEEINTKRKEKVVDHIIQLLIQQFAYDVSSILKKTQNPGIVPVESPPPFPSNGIVTTFQYIRDYVKQLKSFVIENSQYSLKVIENSQINIGPTSKQILTYLRADSAEEQDKTEEYIQNQQQQEDGIFIIPNNLFQIFHQNLIAEQTRKIQKPLTKKVKLFYQFWHRSIFECYNECLDYERPYGITGAPYVWVTQPKMKKKVTMKKLPEIIQNAQNRLLDLTYSPCGIIFQKPDSPYREAALSEECKYQLNQERISRMLANQIMDDEYNWITYNDETAQLLVQITQRLEDALFFQMASQIKKIARRRKVFKMEQSVQEQYAVFQIQQL